MKWAIKAVWRRIEEWIEFRPGIVGRFKAQAHSFELERARWAERSKEAEAERERLQGIVDAAEPKQSVQLAETARLVFLIEKSAEVAQAATKALRFGWNGCSPISGRPNRQSLEREIGRLLAVLELMEACGDVRHKEIAAHRRHRSGASASWTLETISETGRMTAAERGE